MAKRGRFSGGGSYAGIPAQIINQIRQQSVGENTSNTDETVKSNPGTGNATSSKPDYSGIDFTGMSRQQANKAKKAVWSPEFAAEKKAKRMNNKAYLSPFSDAEIAASGALSAIKGGLTYEQALANLRKLTKATNKVPLEGQGSVSKKTSKAYAALTPAQKEAQWAFGILGGYGSDGVSQGRFNPELGKYETYQESMFRRLGLDPSTIKNYAPVKIDTKMDPKYGPVQSIANPLKAGQRSALQRLRGIKQSGGKLSKKQAARLNKLVLKKNAPTILP
jgi:hypothetical protein